MRWHPPQLSCKCYLMPVMYDDLVRLCRERAAEYGALRKSSMTAIALDRSAAAIERLQAELAEVKASEELAWRERNVAYAKVKAWEAVVYVEGLPLRAVRVDEWGPGEGEQTTVPDVTPKRLTELLDELAAIRERT